MSWLKNGAWLAAGGVLGLLGGVLLEVLTESESTSKKEDAPESDGIEVLVGKIRREAEAALASCRTDEEREAVYEQICSSVRQMQQNLPQRGDAIIQELREQAVADEEGEDGLDHAWMYRKRHGLLDEEESGRAERHVQNIKEQMQKFAEALDAALDGLTPAPQM